jgi:hypothetical protein
MVAGEIEPRDIARLLATFDAGLAAPQPAFAATAFAPPPPFLPFDPPRALRRHWLLAARPLHWRRMRRRARALAAEGAVVTLLRLTFTALYHQVRFHPDGYWLHRGGVYGRAERSEPAFLPATLAGRARREAARLAPVRAVDVIEPREAGKGGDGVG